MSHILGGHHPRQSVRDSGDRLNYVPQMRPTAEMLTQFHRAWHHEPWSVAQLAMVDHWDDSGRTLERGHHIELDLEAPSGLFLLSGIGADLEDELSASGSINSRDLPYERLAAADRTAVCPGNRHRRQRFSWSHR